jgi:hypothetical protein
LKTIQIIKLKNTIIIKKKLRESQKLKLVKIPSILLAYSKKFKLSIFIKSIILVIYKIGITLNHQAKIQIINLLLLSSFSEISEKI